MRGRLNTALKAYGRRSRHVACALRGDGRVSTVTGVRSTTENVMTAAATNGRLKGKHVILGFIPLGINVRPADKGRIRAGELYSRQEVCDALQCGTWLVDVMVALYGLQRLGAGDGRSSKARTLSPRCGVTLHTMSWNPVRDGRRRVRSWNDSNANGRRRPKSSRGSFTLRVIEGRQRPLNGRFHGGVDNVRADWTFDRDELALASDIIYRCAFPDEGDVLELILIVGQLLHRMKSIEQLRDLLEVSGVLLDVIGHGSPDSEAVQAWNDSFPVGTAAVFSDETGIPGQQYLDRTLTPAMTSEAQLVRPSRNVRILLSIGLCC